MHRESLAWWSPSLGRPMELLVHGHAGTPVLVFPCSMGRYFEWENFGMVEALRPQIEQGRNQLFCVDSVDAESFYNRSVAPYVRMMRYQQYERYILNEVLPLINHRAPGGFVIAAGASFGAYHAANMVFKHPDRFGKLIALSGAYDIRTFMNGFYDMNVYFNNPVEYLPNLRDHGHLEALRHNHLILTVGEHDPCREANERLAYTLRDKGIPFTFDVLSGAFGHDWPWWRDLLKKHIG